MGCLCCRDREKPDSERPALIPATQQSSLPANSDIGAKLELMRGDSQTSNARSSLGSAKAKKPHIEKGRLISPVNLEVRLKDCKEMLGGLETCFQLTGNTLAQLVQVQHRETKRNYWVQICEFKGEKSIQAMKQQLVTLKSLDHPNLLKMLDVLHEGNNLYVMYEATEGRTAEEYPSLSKEIDEQWVAHVILQVLAALFYCHSKGADVKSLTLRHILFTDNSFTTVKVLVPFNDELDPSSPYVAPELIKTNNVNKANCLWSCGAIISNLLVGELGVDLRKNLGSEHLKSTYRKWHTVSKNGKALVLSLLYRDCRKRPSFKKCMRHPWIAATQTKPPVTTALRTALRNLSTLRSVTPLKKTLFQFMLNFVLPSKDLVEAREAFKELDPDMDGTVTEEELRIQFYRFFPTDEAKAALTSMACADIFSAERKLSYSNFLAYTCGKQIFTEHLNIAFQLLDVDKDGEVSYRDLREFFSLESKDMLESYAWQVLISSISTSMECGFHFAEFSNYMQQP